MLYNTFDQYKEVYFQGVTLAESKAGKNLHLE